MGTTLSYLTKLYGGSSGTQSPSLLATLYGFAGQTTNSLGQNPVTALRSAEQNETKNVQMTAKQPVVQRAVSAFMAGVSSAKTVQQLLANPAVMRVLLTANGLADQIPYTALASKTLQSNVNDPKSLANVLTDKRWKPVVQTYDFAGKGLSVIQNPAVLSTLANAYAEVTWRNSLDATTPGLSNALTFRKEAATIASFDQILGDRVMRTVVTTALGIPLQIAFQPLEAQERAISSRVDITKFKDPKFVESFVQRYLLAANSNATGTGTGTATTPDITTLGVQSQGLVV
jgi:Protein of unknown function (DUF1217)